MLVPLASLLRIDLLYMLPRPSTDTCAAARVGGGGEVDVPHESKGRRERMCSGFAVAYTVHSAAAAALPPAQ